MSMNLVPLRAFIGASLAHKSLMTDPTTAPALLSVDLDAMARNYRTLGRVSGLPVHPVVKADGYGLGAQAVAQRLMAEGADTFFVARAAEGLRLRSALGPQGAGGPIIYVLDGCREGEAQTLKAADLRPVLNHPAQMQTWAAAGGGACGLQIDTGMNRLGLRPEDAPEMFDGLALVLTHLACADEPANPMNRRQRDLFAGVVGRYPGAIRSLANSSGCFLGPDFAFDAVRPGICLYGGGPEGRPDARIAPVATLTARALQVRDVPGGRKRRLFSRLCRRPTDPGGHGGGGIRRRFAARLFAGRRGLHRGPDAPLAGPRVDGRLRGGYHRPGRRRGRSGRTIRTEPPSGRCGGGGRDHQL